ncbi:MAG: tRNA 2-thiocytidine(32) synthetase TtcA [Myxococcaceae bacterium]|jgi:tRNA 2-thiocytidine biosynthesis protein TtcA|nr:tRNA 2-thiocytidine(32) synthetase TtcA [Myxococcaceae bacterium]
MEPQRTAPLHDEKEVLERRLLSKLTKTVHTYGLLQPGERVMVCLSGGKDSYTLLHLLDRLVRTLPFDVRLVAVHLDQRQPGYDGTPLARWLEARGHRFEVLSEDTYAVVKERMAAGQTPCATCSRLRRGILYTAAERLGCTAIALGHHREDTLETLLLNLVYTGKLQAMPASYVTDDGRFRVIRPLIACAEADIARFAALEGFPILPCTLCGSQPDLKREAMNQLLTSLEALNPRVRESMLAALGNVRPTHLLDADVAEAWRRRPEGLEAKSEAKSTPSRFPALPVRSHLDDWLAPVSDPAAREPDP